MSPKSPASPKFPKSPKQSEHRQSERPCEVAVIWIDWYAYHVARFRGLNAVPSLSGKVAGIELVSGVGVHPGLRFREEVPENLRVETLMPGVSWAAAGKLQLARLLWRRLSELKPRVVLVPGYYTLPGVAAALWARLHGRSSVLMTESTAFDHQRQAGREFVKRALLRLLFNWAVTGGKAHVRYLDQLGFPKNRITGCYDVVDNETIQAGTAMYRQRASQAAPQKPCFLFVGRLAEEKNVEALLRSWLCYRENGGSWPLVLAGDGPMAETVRSMAAASVFASDVRFPGLCSAKELLPLYAEAGCFVLPSTREPWGLVVNEAMAAGLPVLVSNRCGCCEDLLIEGENGYSFGSDDEEALTRLLHTMEGMPAGQRGLMGVRSGEIIAGFTPLGFGRAVASIVRRDDRADRLHLLPEVAP